MGQLRNRAKTLGERASGLGKASRKIGRKRQSKAMPKAFDIGRRVSKMDDCRPLDDASLVSLKTRSHGKPVIPPWQPRSERHGFLGETVGKRFLEEEVVETPEEPAQRAMRE